MFRYRTLLISISFALLPARIASAEVPGGFTWQGRLSESGQPYDGVVDLVFTLHDGEAGAGQLGPTLTLDDHPVTAGLIIVDLDFGSGLFDGQPRWLEIDVNGATLAPRQPVMPAPYAIQALSVPAMSIVPSMFAPDAVTSVALASDPGSLSKVSGGAVSATGGDVVVGSNLSVNQTLVSDFSRSGGYLARSPGGSGAATLSLDAEADPGGGSWFLSSHADNSPFGTPGGTFSLYNGEDRLAITADGRVGIGTTDFDLGKVVVQQDDFTPESGLTLVGPDGGVAQFYHYLPFGGFNIRSDDFIRITPALEIQGGPNAPPVRLRVLGGTVELPDDSIEANETRDEAGVTTWRSDVVEIVDAAEVTTLVSSVIDCPSDGFVVAIGTTEIRAGLLGDLLTEVGISADDTVLGNQAYFVGVLNTSERRAVTVHGVFEVTAGANEFFLLTQHGGIQGINPRLTLMFTPTAYGPIYP